MKKVEQIMHGVGMLVTCFLMRKILGRTSLSVILVTVAMMLQEFMDDSYIADFMSTLSTFVYLNIRPRYLTAGLTGLQRHISKTRRHSDKYRQ